MDSNKTKRIEKYFKPSIFKKFKLLTKITKKKVRIFPELYGNLYGLKNSVLDSSSRLALYLEDFNPCDTNSIRRRKSSPRTPFTTFMNDMSLYKANKYFFNKIFKKSEQRRKSCTDIEKITDSFEIIESHEKRRKHSS